MDRCYETLKELNVTAVIDAGQSTLATLNPFPASDDGKYKISFRSPSLDNTNKIILQSKISSDFFVSTSGDYEHYYFDKDGNMLSHILDATTGKSNHYCRSVTLISNTPNSLAILDATSTAIFNLESNEKVEKLLTSIKDTYHINDIYFMIARPYYDEDKISYEKYNLVISNTFAYTIISDFDDNVVKTEFLKTF